MRHQKIIRTILIRRINGQKDFVWSLGIRELTAFNFRYYLSTYTVTVNEGARIPQ